MVTETDKAIEDTISSHLKSKYPDFSFVGEETYMPGTPIGPEPTFIVDPIDGTTNFIHSFPWASISLGLAIDRKSVVGVVYNPFLDLLYFAVKGQGAYLTTRPGGSEFSRRLPLAKSPQPLTNLNSSLVCVEWPAAREGPNFDVKADTFRNLTASPDNGGGSMVRSLRSLGSAALNLCAVAAGQLDLYWEGGCWAWDVCAGWCVLDEAGGLMVDGNPGNWEPRLEERTYLAVRAAPSGQKEIVEEFWGAIRGRMEYEH